MGLNCGDESADVGLQQSESGRQCVVMRDLQCEDINYANGFPANICNNSCVVVQIPEQGQGVVLYTCKVRGTQARCYLPLEFAERYTNNIYVFDA